MNVLSAAEIGFMPNYGIAHLSVLAITVVAVAVLVPAARRDDRWVTPVGWVVLIASVAWMLWWLLPANFDLMQSLPFHLSDWLRIITGVALITRRSWAVLMSYYWGLTLNLQALLTPDLVYFRYPAVEFVMYWFLHVAAFVAPIVLVWGLGHRPTWRGYGVGFGTTLVWAGVALTVNTLLGTNYGFVSQPPGQASALDYLGPWPWYLVSVALILAAVFALMTWPWTTLPRQAGTVLAHSGLTRYPVPLGRLAPGRGGDTIGA